ncbi:MAG: pre-peptidase C-terminal domain-containing protein [Candidatus Sericytochromatia bacterium]
MKLNVRGLAGTCAVAALVGVAGCVTVTAPAPGTGNGTNSPRPAATASTDTTSPAPNASMSPGASTSASPGATPSATVSAPVAFKCDTPAAITLATGNTDFATAQVVGACSTITATLPGEGEGDRFFKVSIPAGVYDGRLKVTVNESSSDYIPSLRIYNASKADRSGASAPDYTATPLVHEQDVTAGQDYYVKLSEPSSAVQATVRFEFVPTVDVFERNDTFETARMLMSGQTVNLIHFAGSETLNGDDVDFFKFEVPAGKTKVSMKIVNKSTADEGQIWNVRLLSASKADLEGAVSPNYQADVSADWTVPSAGTYYLQVAGGTNSTVASQLTVTPH